jgi:hypothetical protein
MDGGEEDETRIEHIGPFLVDDFPTSLSQEHETVYGFQLPPSPRNPCVYRRILILPYPAGLEGFVRIGWDRSRQQIMLSSPVNLRGLPTGSAA